MSEWYEDEAEPEILDVLEEAGATFSYSPKWTEEMPVFCPFCPDKTSKKPAGKANMIKNVYFCFACGVGGSAKSLLKRVRDGGK